MPKPKVADDPIMISVRRAYAHSRLSLEQLGKKMGYTGDVARKAAWQFLNKTHDPRFSMLRRFAEAIGVSVKSLV